MASVIPLVVSVATWVATTAAFVALAVVFDAAEIGPFATSSAWAPPLGAMLALLPAWYAFRRVARRQRTRGYARTSRHDGARHEREDR